MKIDATNIDSYYKKINDIIDGYFNFKVTAKALKLHFSKKDNIKRLLEANKLNDIENIHIVLNDVINDRYFNELDVQTFESFSNIKDTIFWLLRDSGIYEERILSDYLHVSLSNIELVDAKTHMYKVKDKTYLVYTDHDISDFAYAIRKKVKNIITESIIKYDTLEIEVSEIYDSNKLERILVNYVDTNVMLKNITKELKIEIVKNETFKNNNIIIEIKK